MPITAVYPSRGSAGTDVIIEGSGFANSTGVQFGGIAAAWIAESDTVIRATVPPGAIAGKVRVLDPQGTMESPEDFDVVQSSLPQNTTRGRAALDAITLIIAAAARGDVDGVSRFLSPTVFLVSQSLDVDVIEKPAANAPAGMVQQFNDSVMAYVPTDGFNLEHIFLANDAVVVSFTGLKDANTKNFLYVFRGTGAGYRVAMLGSNEI